MEKEIPSGMIAGLSAGNKPWNQCTSEEKIEKLRSEAQQMQFLANRVQQLSEQIEQLKKHDHINGNLVIPIQNQGGTLMGGVGRFNPLA